MELVQLFIETANDPQQTPSLLESFMLLLKEEKEETEYRTFLWYFENFLMTTDVLHRSEGEELAAILFFCDEIESTLTEGTLLDKIEQELLQSSKLQQVSASSLARLVAIFTSAKQGSHLFFQAIEKELLQDKNIKQLSVTMCVDLAAHFASLPFKSPALFAALTKVFLKKYHQLDEMSLLNLAVIMTQHKYGCQELNFVLAQALVRSHLEPVSSLDIFRRLVPFVQLLTHQLFPDRVATSVSVKELLCSGKLLNPENFAHCSSTEVICRLTELTVGTKAFMATLEEEVYAIGIHQLPRDELLVIAHAFTVREAGSALFVQGLVTAMQNHKTAAFVKYCELGFTKITLEFVNSGWIKPNEVLENGLIPLHLAVQYKLPALITMLLDKGAWIDKKDADGNTALHHSCAQGDRETTQLLLDRKANFTSLNHQNLPPLLHAMQAACVAKDPEKMKSFFKYIFADYFEVYRTVAVLISMVPDDVASQFTASMARSPDHIIRPESTARARNPFEIALLLQDKTVFEKLCPLLNEKELLTALEELETKFPHYSRSLLINTAYPLRLDHLNKELCNLPLPKKPDGVHVRDLLRIFKEINFLNPNQLNYVPAGNFFEPDDIANSTQQALYDQLTQRFKNNFISVIEKKTAFLGTPKEGTGLREFYDVIETQITHTLSVLQQLPPCPESSIKKMKTIAAYLRTAGKCGGRLWTVAEQQYDEVVNQLDAGFENRLFKCLGKFRKMILESLIPYIDNNVHHYTRLMHLIGRQLDIPGATLMVTFNDPYRADGEQLDSQQVLHQFFEKYTTADIIALLHLELISSGDFREAFIDWCKENIPNDWKKDYYNNIWEQVCDMVKLARPNSEIQSMLQKKHEIFTPTLPELTLQSFTDAVNADRTDSYLNEKIFAADGSGKIRESALLFMLHTTGIADQHRPIVEPVQQIEELMVGNTALRQNLINEYRAVNPTSTGMNPITAPVRQPIEQLL